MKWTAQNKAAASLATLAFLATLAGLSLTIWSRQIKTLVDPKAALKAEQAATETFAKAKPNFANVLTDDAIVSSIPTAKEAKPPSGLVKSQPFGAIAPAQKPKPSVLELLSDLNPTNWITQSNPLSDRAKRNETARSAQSLSCG